jgi:ApbE superfamily uncharacterized protein (UPF0280 family)
MIFNKRLKVGNYIQKKPYMNMPQKDVGVDDNDGPEIQEID